MEPSRKKPRIEAQQCVATLVPISSTSQSDIISIPLGDSKIGRDTEQCEHLVQDMRISRVHVMLHASEERTVLTSMSASNPIGVLLGGGSGWVLVKTTTSEEVELVCGSLIALLCSANEVRFDYMYRYQRQAAGVQSQQADHELALPNAAEVDDKPALQARLRADGDEEAVLQARLHAAAEEKAALQARLQGGTEEKAVLHARLHAETKEKAALQARLHAAAEEKAALQAQLRAETEEKAALQAQLHAETEEKAALQAQLHAETGEKAALQVQLTTQIRSPLLLQEVQQQRRTALNLVYKPIKLEPGVHNVQLEPGVHSVQLEPGDDAAVLFAKSQKQQAEKQMVECFERLVGLGGNQEIVIDWDEVGGCMQTVPKGSDTLKQKAEIMGRYCLFN